MPEEEGDPQQGFEGQGPQSAGLLRAWRRRGRQEDLGLEASARDDAENSFLQLTSKAITVMEQIETNPEWLWGKNEANLGRLSSSLEALEGALGEFDNNFIMKPAPSLRRGMTKERLIVGLEQCMLLEEPLTKLHKYVDGLLAMHAAMGRLTRHRGWGPAQRGLLA